MDKILAAFGGKLFNRPEEPIPPEEAEFPQNGMPIQDALKQAFPQDEEEMSDAEMGTSIMGEEGGPPEEEGPNRGITPAESKESSMSNEEIVNFAITRKNQCEETKISHKEAWDEVWNRYNLQYDFTDKEDWQSKIISPRVFFMVEKSASVFSKGLEKIKRWFRVDMSPEYQVFADTIRKWMEFWLNKMGFRHIYSEVIKTSLMSQLAVLRVGWDYVKSKRLKNGEFIEFTKDKPEVVVVDPYFFWYDKDWRMERVDMPVYQFKQMCDEGTFQLEPGVDPYSLGVPPTDYEKSEEAARKGEYPTPDTLVPQVRLYYYWGNICSRTGELIYENIYLVIANERILVQGPTENPFFSGEDPYVIASIINVPKSRWHNSIISAAMETLDGMTELYNLIIDAISLSTLGEYEMDVTASADPKQVQTGHYPLKTWKKNGQTPLMQQVTNTAVPPEAFTLYQLMDRESQYSGISEMMTGMPRLRGRVSAYETAVRSNESLGLFDHLITDLEDTLLVPFLRKFFLTMIQYQYDFSNPMFTRNIPEVMELAKLPPKLRYELFGMDTEFIVSGLSAVLDKAQDLEKLGYVIKLLGNNSALAQRIKPEVLLRIVFESINWDTYDLIYTEEEVIAKMQQAAMMQQGGGMPGMPPPGGAPPGGMPPKAEGGGGFSPTSGRGQMPKEGGIGASPQPEQGVMSPQDMQQIIATLLGGSPSPQ